MNGLLSFHRRIALQGATEPLERLFFLFLLPLALVYGLIGGLRNRCYDWQLLTSYRASVPVISVGNLAVGGTGKTPVVDWLVKDFLDQGRRPAVVSRGYGGSFAGKVGIVSTGNGLLLKASEAGDEPVLLASRNPQALVFVARKRAAGVQLAVEGYGADVIILDDGFQHRAVQRDLDLVLLDAANPYGNRWPLPAGLLREFPSALKRADLLLLTRSNGEPTFTFSDKPVFSCQHRLADRVVALTGEELSIEDLQSARLFAFAGIAAPAGFFFGLQTNGLQLMGQMSLGDHCKYDAQLLSLIEESSRGCDALLTTEKDAVKLKSDSFNVPCYQVPMSVALKNETEFRNTIKLKLWSS